MGFCHKKTTFFLQENVKSSDALKVLKGTSVKFGENEIERYICLAAKIMKFLQCVFIIRIFTSFMEIPQVHKHFAVRFGVYNTDMQRASPLL